VCIGWHSIKYPNIERFPGGASNDMIPNLQNPKNPLPYDPMKVSKTVGAGGGWTQQRD
jgi:hypothetical protein